jgi:hypothetical protein
VVAWPGLTGVWLDHDFRVRTELARSNPAVQDGDPAQGRAQLVRARQDQPGGDAEAVQVEVGLLEAVEQDQAAGYVLKQIRGDELVRAIRAVGAGQNLARHTAHPGG